MRCTKRLSISDATRALHCTGLGGAGTILYPKDPRAHGMQWVHQVPAQIHALWFLGGGLTRPFLTLGLAMVPQGFSRDAMVGQPANLGDMHEYAYTNYAYACNEQFKY